MVPAGLTQSKKERDLNFVVAENRGFVVKHIHLGQPLSLVVPAGPNRLLLHSIRLVALPVGRPSV